MFFSFIFMQRCGGHNCKLLKIELHNSVHKHLGVFSSVPFWYIHDIRLQNDGVHLAILGKLVYGSDRSIIIESVLPSHDTKAQNMLLIIENLEPLSAGGGREPRNHGDLSNAPNPTIAGHGATLDEVLVLLGVVKASDEGPDNMGRSIDLLGDEGSAGVGRRLEGVVGLDDGFESSEFLICEAMVVVGVGGVHGRDRDQVAAALD